MDFVLFLALSANLLIRPAEFVPSLLGLPIYESLILACVAAALGPLVQQFSARALVSEQPLTSCIVAVMIMIVVSNVVPMRLELAGETGLEFLKLFVFYQLLIAVVNSPERLRRYLLSLSLFAAVITTLAVLQYHGLVAFQALDALVDGVEDDAVRRLRGTGMFGDPNDMSLLLVISLMMALYGLSDRVGLGLMRVVWLAPIGLFLYAMMLTHSRGGLMALLAALGGLLFTRYGWRSIGLAAAALPVLLLSLGGRQTELSSSTGTAQQRVQIWNDGLVLFGSSPVLGVGCKQYAVHVGFVAHNSYIHAFAELGFLGGMFFLGAFVVAAQATYRVVIHRDDATGQELRRVRPYLIAVVSGYSGGMLSLSRCYEISTYLVLGLVTAYLNLAGRDSEANCPRFEPAMVGRFAGLSVLFVIVARIYVRWALRY